MHRVITDLKVRLSASKTANTRTLLKILSAAFLLAIALMAAGTASAQVGLSHAHPNLARGTGRDKTKDKYEWDVVNFFNGNLNISIPLGIKYPVAGEFGYQFSLTYNSNVWDLDQPSGVVTAAPVRNSNAGFGRDPSFGRLPPPTASGTLTGRWVYVSPDASIHPFYSPLHYDVSESDPGDSVLYTRDGTYYRMRYVASDQIFIDSPDGMQSLFKLTSGEWK